VSDHDQLRGVTKFFDDVDETTEVDIVKRGLDFVEDVEGARAGEHQGEREAKRSHRLITTREHRQGANFLARWLDFELDTRLGYLDDGVDILTLGLGLCTCLVFRGVGRIEASVAAMGVKVDALTERVGRVEALDARPAGLMCRVALLDCKLANGGVAVGVFNARAVGPRKASAGVTFEEAVEDADQTRLAGNRAFALGAFPLDLSQLLVSSFALFCSLYLILRNQIRMRIS
jgi:hypothetical protein